MNSLAVRKAQEKSAELRGKAKVEYVDADIKKLVEEAQKKQAEAIEAAKKPQARAASQARLLLRVWPARAQRRPPARRPRRLPDRNKINAHRAAGRLLQAARSVSWAGLCTAPEPPHGQARPRLPLCTRLPARRAGGRGRALCDRRGRHPLQGPHRSPARRTGARHRGRRRADALQDALGAGRLVRHRPARGQGARARRQFRQCQRLHRQEGPRGGGDHRRCRRGRRRLRAKRGVHRLDRASSASRWKPASSRICSASSPARRSPTPGTLRRAP